MALSEVTLISPLLLSAARLALVPALALALGVAGLPAGAAVAANAPVAEAPSVEDARSDAQSPVMSGGESSVSLTVSVDKGDRNAPEGAAKRDGAADEAQVEAASATAPKADPRTAPAPSAQTDDGAVKNAPAAAQETTTHAASRTKAPAAGGDAAAQTDRGTSSFFPSVALVRHLSKESELAAMQLSLALVTFVGEMEPTYVDEDTYAVLPLAHDSVLEIYDLHFDGAEVTQMEKPTLVRAMKANEAYVFRVPTFAGKPTREVCVSTNGRRHCWRPGDDEMCRGFLHWSRTKGME